MDVGAGAQATALAFGLGFDRRAAVGGAAGWNRARRIDRYRQPRLLDVLGLLALAVSGPLAAADP